MKKIFACIGRVATFVLVSACFADTPVTAGQNGGAGQGGTHGEAVGGQVDCSPQPPPGFSGKCSPLQACGCLQGENCWINNSDEFICRSSGHVPLGQACSSVTDCSPGLQCVGGGFCSKICFENDDCGKNKYCRPSSILGVGLCNVFCDPVAPQKSDEIFDACGPGFTCIANSEEQIRTNCYKQSGVVPEGGSCSPGKAECLPGYSCGSEGICGKYCYENFQCVSKKCLLSDQLLIAGKPLGICQ